jgi:hypothetical protein
MLSLVARQSQQSELLGYTWLTFCASAFTIDMSKKPISTNWLKAKSALCKCKACEPLSAAEPCNRKSGSLTGAVWFHWGFFRVVLGSQVFQDIWEKLLHVSCQSFIEKS